MNDGATDGLPAVEYHERTSHSPASVRTGPGLDFENKPRPDKRYLRLPREPLPAVPAGPDVPALDAIAIEQVAPPTIPPFPTRAGARVDRDVLAQLCVSAAGITKELRIGERTVAFRAAACTGALYHVDLYPVVGELDDLAAGVYHFDPASMHLDVIRTGEYRGVLATAAGHPRVAEAPISFVVTSTWWRNAWKYRGRTYRHAFWDSGTALSNLVAAAHARGLPAEIVMSFADEEVATLLGIDPTSEAPLEVVPVGAWDPAPDPQPVEPIDPETAPLSPDPQDYPAIHQAWRAGTISDGSVARTWRDLVREATPVGVTDPGTGDRIALDPVDRESASSRPLGETIRRRGSTREYTGESISVRQLSTILDRACRGLPLDVRNDPSDGRERRSPLGLTDPYLIVHAVDGLPAGSYHYRPEVGELERLQAGTFRREAGHLALGQRLAADAAVCIYFMADVDAIVAALGDRGYRVAQFEAAATAGRLYLATYAHRVLGGTGLTFFDDRVTAFFSPRASEQTPMFLYTVGRPA